MKKLAIILVIVALAVGLNGDPVEAKGWSKYVVCDSMDVSAQTGDAIVEIKGYDGKVGRVSGLIEVGSYTYTTTAGDLSFYITDGTGGTTQEIIEFPVDIVTNGTKESDGDYDLTDAVARISLGMAPNVSGSVNDYYVYGKRLYFLYDHNGGDTGKITVILYIKNE